jgi:hypothetical protein
MGPKAETGPRAEAGPRAKGSADTALTFSKHNTRRALQVNWPVCSLSSF